MKRDNVLLLLEDRVLLRLGNLSRSIILARRLVERARKSHLLPENSGQ